MLLLEAVALLRRGDPQGALALLGSRRPGDLLFDNARGVCLMRLGRARSPIGVYQQLVLHPGSINLRLDVPPVLVTNFATALLLEGNVTGCSVILRELGDDVHPAVVRLRAAIDRWRSQLGWWERLQFSLYGAAKRPVDLGTEVGELLLPQPDRPRRAA